MDLTNASSYWDFFDTKVLRPASEKLILDNSDTGCRLIDVYSPQAVLLSNHGPEDLERLSFMGRLAWEKDWRKDPEQFVRHILKMKHESVIEHLNFNFLILCDRATSHEIVRHRIGHSYTQMSQRYISYGDWLKPAPFCLPEMISSSDGLRPLTDSEEYFLVDGAVMTLVHYRVGLEEVGFKPEQARLVLPNECATIIGMTVNARSLRHFLRLRMAGSAYPQIRAVANDMYDAMVDCGLGVLVEEFQELQVAFDTRGGVENRLQVDEVA